MTQECEILNHYQETFGERLIRDSKDKKVLCLKERANVPFLTFPKLSACDKIEHLFTIRAGGVSTGHLTSMNFSLKMGDTEECVLENFRRVSRVLECDLQDMVGTAQTHTTNIRIVTGKDGGKGILYPQDYQDVDGLITNEKGLTLCAYTADCVPIFYADPVKEAIGIAHSGWRGTVGNMAGKMTLAMHEEFGSLPEDLIVGIGPSICRKCYEVDETVARQFEELMENADDIRRVVLPGKAAGKYQLDLWQANRILLMRAGVLEDHIDVTDICTACNPRILFSHRASHGKRGNMGGMIRMKETGRHL